MDLRPSEEQVQLQDMVRRFLSDRGGASAMGHGPMATADWAALGELGLFAFLLPERAGGMGGTPQDAMIVAEQLGQSLAITPLAEGLLLCADLIVRHGTDEQIASCVQPMMAGQALLGFADGDVWISRTAKGCRIDGTAPFVRWGAQADSLLVVVRQQQDAIIAIVDARAPGVSRTPCRLADGTIAAKVDFAGVTLSDDAIVTLSASLLETALARAELAIVAELVGIMTLLQEATLDYIKQRRQFGVPIGSFQVIQHRAARMFIALEQSRSMLLKPALTDPAHPGWRHQVTAAKAYVAEAALRLAQDAVQLHGGIGVTDELPVGRGHRRILVLSRLFGDAVSARSLYVAACFDDAAGTACQIG